MTPEHSLYCSGIVYICSGVGQLKYVTGLNTPISSTEGYLHDVHTTNLLDMVCCCSR